LTGVTCTNTTRCVTVGFRRGPGTVAQLSAIAEQWNGRRWSVVSTPAPAGQYPSWILSGVSCAGANNCFAVGFAGTIAFSTAAERQPLVEHWDGTQWSIMDTPNPSAPNNAELNGVTCPNPTTCYAVGEYQSSAATNTLAETYA
jgi:hypothetical protein